MELSSLSCDCLMSFLQRVYVIRSILLPMFLQLVKIGVQLRIFGLVWHLCAAFNQFPIFDFLNLFMTRKKNEIVYWNIPLDRSSLSCKLSLICEKLAHPMYSNQIARIITKANYVEYVISITSLNQSNASLYSLWLTSLTVIRHRNPNHYTPLDVNSALHSHT